MLKKIFILVGVTLLFGLSYLIKLDLDKFKILDKGNDIEVLVVNIPVSCKVSNKDIKPYFEFSYNNKRYTKRLEGKYCKNVIIGKTLMLKTNFDRTMFLYTDEKIKHNLYSLISLIIIISICFYKIIKKL